MTRFKPSQFDSHSIRASRVDGIPQTTLAAAFNAVDPASAVRNFLAMQPLPESRSTYVLGLGKAACAMANALAGSVKIADALIITKHASPLELEPATVILGDHPIPGDASCRAGNAVLQFLSRLEEDDLLLCLISGGGSALMTAPVIPLADLKGLTSALLKCGARIDEINILRRHLDLLKGGGVIEHANDARVISLILSDVVGDSLEAIASGPTTSDPTFREDAIRVIQKYGLEKQIPASVFAALRETLKPENPLFQRVQNCIVASNIIAIISARSHLESLGVFVTLVDVSIQGEAREIGKEMAFRFRAELQKHPRPFCLVAGGETTVTVAGIGKGGRNQEIALGAVSGLAGLKDVMLIAIATDGEDGPTDAAGAVVTGETAQRAERLGMDAADFLSRNDANSFFASLGDLILTGPSGTNVNDLILCFAF